MPAALEFGIGVTIGDFASTHVDGAGWAREPFTSESPTHVSVWQKTI
jgi:hypothetical protein